MGNDTNVPDVFNWSIVMGLQVVVVAPAGFLASLNTLDSQVTAA